VVLTVAGIRPLVVTERPLVAGLVWFAYLRGTLEGM
jgi:hypothetical protein